MRKIALTALCLLVSIFSLTGCSSNSEPFEEKSYTADAQISEINLDVRDREIEVALSADEQIHIQYSRDEKSRTFSSNSRRSHILRTSSRSIRLILSSIVSLAVWLKCTRTI